MDDDFRMSEWVWCKCKEGKVPKRYLKVRDKLVGSLDIMEEIVNCRKRKCFGWCETIPEIIITCWKNQFQK